MPVLYGMYLRIEKLVGVICPRCFTKQCMSIINETTPLILFMCLLRNLILSQMKRAFCIFYVNCIMSVSLFYEVVKCLNVKKGKKDTYICIERMTLTIVHIGNES